VKMKMTSASKRKPRNTMSVLRWESPFVAGDLRYADRPTVSRCAATSFVTAG
jgi:hypothetical protein